MKKLLTLSLLALAFIFNVNAQEYKIVTVIESIIPMGLGRSRILEHTQSQDYKNFTTAREDGKDSKQGDVKRGDAKVDALEETKLLNFFSGVGINFQNIASNDAIISSKINAMTQEGWQLAFVTSAVESVGSKDDNNGIFITRLVFKK